MDLDLERVDHTHNEDQWFEKKKIGQVSVRTASKASLACGHNKWKLTKVQAPPTELVVRPVSLKLDSDYFIKTSIQNNRRRAAVRLP